MPQENCLRFNTSGSFQREEAPAPLSEHRVVRLYTVGALKILALTLEACIGSPRVGAILLLRW